MKIIKSFTFKIDPVPKGRPRFSRRGRCYTPKKTKTFEGTVKRLLSAEYGEKCLIDYPVGVIVIFTIARPKSVKRPWPSVKPDCDNLQKSVFDALNGTVLVDDSLICDIRAIKRYGVFGQIDLQIYKLT